MDQLTSISTITKPWGSRQAAKIMYMLKNDEYLATMFLIFHPFLTAFAHLHTNKKWHSYTKHLELWQPISDPTMNVKEEFMKILRNAGFEIIKCIEVYKCYVHPSREQFLDYFKSVDPFISKIPKEKRKEFQTEGENLLLEQGLTIINEKNEVTHKYKLIYVVAKKP